MNAPQANALQGAIHKLAFREPLTADDAEAAFDIVMQGQATAVQVAALLSALRATGESPEVVAGVVRALRSAMVSLAADDPENLVDTCGTGGGAVPTFNISTAAALVAAGAGVRIAKHGNRSFTSRCGSADVLEALGVPIEVPVPVMEGALREVGIVFMFAPLMHPAMRHVGPVRRELGVQTVMNMVGPLANPAHAGRQVVGVSDPRRLPLIAGALRELDTVHALVVHGDGMDEISPFSSTDVVEIRNGQLTEWKIDPHRYGFGGGVVADLAGGPPADNAATIIKVLRGDANEASMAAVALNAAAALYAGGAAQSFDEGVEMAKAGIGSGAGLVALERLRAAFTR